MFGGEACVKRHSESVAGCSCNSKPAAYCTALTSTCVPPSLDAGPKVCELGRSPAVGEVDMGRLGRTPVEKYECCSSQRKAGVRSAWRHGAVRLIEALHALRRMQALASCSIMLTCRHWTAVGRLLGSQEHMAVIRSTASGQALLTILDMEVGANCDGQVQVQTGVRHMKSKWHPGRTWPCKRVLAAHLRKAEVHCCGKLQAFRPRLLRRGAQNAADFVDLIRLGQAQQGEGRFGEKLNVNAECMSRHPLSSWSSYCKMQSSASCAYL